MLNSLFTCLHKLNKILKKNITISFTESNNIICYLKQIQKNSVYIMYIATDCSVINKKKHLPFLHSGE